MFVCWKFQSIKAADLLVNLNTSLDIDDRKRQKCIAISDVKMGPQRLGFLFASKIYCWKEYKIIKNADCHS